MATLTESRLREIIKEEMDQMGMGAPEAAPGPGTWVIHMSPRTAQKHSDRLRALARQFGTELHSQYPGEFSAVGGDIEGFSQASTDYVRSKRIRAYVGY